MKSKEFFLVTAFLFFFYISFRNLNPKARAKLFDEENAIFLFFTGISLNTTQNIIFSTLKPTPFKFYIIVFTEMEKQETILT